MSLHGTSLLSVWKFLPQPSSQVLPALALQRGGSFLLYCLGLSSPALSAPDTLLCPHLGHVHSHDTRNFVTTRKWSCLSNLLGSSKRKQRQLIGNQPKSLGSPFLGGETGWMCVFSFTPLLLSISVNLDQVSAISLREVFSKSKYFLHGILLYEHFTSS